MAGRVADVVVLSGDERRFLEGHRSTSKPSFSRFKRASNGARLI